MADGMKKAGLELVAENAEQYIRDVGRAGDASAKLDTAVGQAADGISAKGSALQGVFQGIGMAAVDMALQAGDALVQFVGDSITAAGDFEGGMNLFAAAAGDMGQQELGQFKDLFLALGKELPVSTQEVQDAAIALVRGGIDPAVIAAGGLEDSLKFAAAAGMDLEKAAELSVKQLGTFVPVGASVDEQTRFMAESQELLVKAANASTLDVEALGDAMLQAGGQARAAGLDYDDFVTTMGLISPAFGSAAEAGTSFKNLLVRLQPSTKPARDAMADLGLMTQNTQQIIDDFHLPPNATVEDAADALGEYAAAVGLTEGETQQLINRYTTSVFYDAQGQFIGMEQAATILKEKLGGLTDQQRIQALQTIFGNDAMGAAATLVEGGGEAYRAFAEQMAAANGVQEQAAATQQGFNFQLENMQGSLEALQITLGSALLPLLSSFIADYLTPGINVITDFATAILGAEDPVAALQTALGSLFVVYEDGSGTVSSFLETLGLGEDVAQVVGQAIADAGKIISGLVAENLPRFQSAWQHDVLPAVTEVQRFFVEDLAPILSDLAEAFLPAIDAALDVAAGFWEDVLVPAITTAWDFLNASLIPILKVVAEWLKENLPPAIRATADFFTETLFPAIHTVYDFIDTKVIPLFEAVADVLSAVVGVAIKELAKLWDETLKPALDDLVQFINENVKPVLDGLGEWLGDVTGGFEGINSAIDTAIGWLGDLADAIRGMPDLPDGWMPGSPPPIQIGFEGIAGAMADVTAQFAPLGSAIAGLDRVTPDALPLPLTGPTTNIYQGSSTSITMPVYTNQSPAVLQQSYAVMQALVAL